MGQKETKIIRIFLMWWCFGFLNPLCEIESWASMWEPDRGKPQISQLLKIHFNSTVPQFLAEFWDWTINEREPSSFELLWFSSFWRPLGARVKKKCIRTFNLDLGLPFVLSSAAMGFYYLNRMHLWVCFQIVLKFSNSSNAFPSLQFWTKIIFESFTKTGIWKAVAANPLKLFASS